MQVGPNHDDICNVVDVLAQRRGMLLMAAATVLAVDQPWRTAKDLKALAVRIRRMQGGRKMLVDGVSSRKLNPLVQSIATSKIPLRSIAQVRCVLEQGCQGLRYLRYLQPPSCPRTAV